MSFGTLFVTYQSGRMEVVELEKPTVTLGSAVENDVVLRDDAAEPFHAQVLCDDTGCQVLDLGTTSGTLFGGTPLEPYLPEPLADRAIFTIGAVTMLYCVPETEEFGDGGAASARLVRTNHAGGLGILAQKYWRLMK